MKTVKELLEAYQHSLIKADDIEGQSYVSKTDTRRPAKFPPEKDIPNVLTLTRKAIRVFPDNQKIALYYSYALDKYLSVPYGPNNKAMGIHLNEDQKSRDKQNIAIKDPDLYRYYLKTIKGKKGKPVTDADVVARMDTVTAAQHGKALKKAGQILSKGFNPSTAGAAFGTALRGGYEAGKRGVKKVVRKISSPSSKSMFPVVEEYSTPSERFKSNLKQVRIDEITAGQVADTAADYTLPFYTAGKKIKQGDYKGAAIEGGIDAAAIAAGALATPFTGGAGAVPAAMATRGALRGTIKGVSKYLEKAAAKRAKKAAAKKAEKEAGVMGSKEAMQRGVSRGGKPKPQKGGSRLGTGKKGSGFGTALGLSALSGLAGSDTPVKDLFKRSEQQTPFSQAGRASYAPGQDQSSAALDWQRMNSRQFAARKQPVQEENFNKIKTIAEKNIKKDVIVFEDTSITINNRIAKKIVNLYESLNKDNKQKVVAMLNEDVNSFRKIINFALRH